MNPKLVADKNACQTPLALAMGFGLLVAKVLDKVIGKIIVRAIFNGTYVGNSPLLDFLIMPVCCSFADMSFDIRPNM